MSILTRDFNKGLDLSGETEIQATQINQMIDVARPANDKGLVIETTDTDAETIVVPDPDIEQDGITPIWWKRYIWKRNIFGGGTYCYIWDYEALSDATFKQWIRVDQDAADALTVANAADNNADAALAAAAAAQATADDASTLAFEANTQAIIAQSLAGDAQKAADSIIGSNLKTGMILPFLGTTVFSKSQDDGWLDLDGSSVPTATFERLAAVLGVSGSTFTLPDWRGRTVVGSGHADDLTNRVKGTIGGSETVILNASQVFHKHVTGRRDTQFGDWFRLITTGAVTNLVNYLSSTVMRYKGEAGGEAAETSGNLITSEPVEHGGAESSPHDNMMPWAAARFIIKT